MARADTDAAGRSGSRALTVGLIAGVLAAAGAAWLVVGLLGSGGVPVASGPPRFVEQASAAGIDHRYDGEFTFFVGGGVAVLDCNDDGRSDMYLAGGENPASLYRNDSDIGGDLRFARVGDAATDMTEVVGAYPLDIDSDASTDLVVVRLGENVLLRGLGDCRFERANEAWGFDGGDRWTAGFSAKWEDGATLPTLAFGNYLELDAIGAPTGACAGNELFRPVDGAYTEATPLEPGWCTLSVLFSDWNHSGQVDLRMTNDRHYYRDGQEQLWAVAPGETPRLYTDDQGWKPMQIWGMGIASHDLTGDGIPEVFLTSQGDNKLQTLDEGATGPSYGDIAIRRGVTAHRPFTDGAVLPSTAWHPEFQDVNNDGFVDLYISKGNVDAMVEYAADDPGNLLLGQPDGTFVESALDSGIVNPLRTRGAALADFNLDGLLDLVEVNRRENVTLWRNVGGETVGNWVAIDLHQRGSNSDAIGSWLEVDLGDRSTVIELTIGGGHAGDQLGWIHIGLGDRADAKVRVQWPDGEFGPWQRIEASTFAIIERDVEQPVRWEP